MNEILALKNELGLFWKLLHWKFQGGYNNYYIKQGYLNTSWLHDAQVEFL